MMYDVRSMMYDDLTIQKLRELPIFDVCQKLGISLYGMGQLTRRAKCWYHDDKHPSMHVNKKRNIYKCFVCGKGGDVIRLVQDNENLSFPKACEWLMNEFSIAEIHSDGRSMMEDVGCVTSDISLQTSDIIALNPDLVKKVRSTSSVFCQSLLSCNYMTYQQLKHAAEQYHLGVSKDGGVVFWQIDEQQRIRTGKVMYYRTDCHRIKERNPTWVHSLLKRQLPEGWALHRCLFGQHLLSSKAPGATVCVVESEKTAVICSEQMPDCAWLACGGLQMLNAEMLQPLTDYKVVIFPDTDTTGDTFRQWYTIAQQAQKQYPFRYPLRISGLLELHATEAQKHRKIDLVDFLFEGQGSTDITDPTDSCLY